MDNSKKTKRKILVTQALPYANAPLHLGHILEAVQTDIWTRFQNFNGNECLFFCADDTHGTPVMLKANEMGIKSEELISDVYKDHKSSYELYGINFANFYSTHSDENRKYSEYIYECAKNNNLISKANIEQYYDEKEEMFLSDRFIKGTCPKCGAEDQNGDNCGVCGASYNVLDVKKPISIISNTAPIKKESEHIFFDLPQKNKMLKDFLKNVDLQESIKNKLNEWLNDDLKKWDISRDAPYFGFEIPGEENRYFYVWVDAPIGYLASISNWAEKNKLNMQDLWSENSKYEIYHFIGKDIAYFHGLFWPALLSAANLKLPSGINVHGFLTINGEKMSKSKGTGILAKEFAEITNPETLRYYFAAKLNNKVEDIDLNFDDYVQRINSDLVGKYLNIASRSASFLKKNNNILSTNIDNNILDNLASKKDEVVSLYESREYSKLVRIIMDLADDVNKYINEQTPWKKEIDEAVYSDKPQFSYVCNVIDRSDGQVKLFDLRSTIYSQIVDYAANPEYGNPADTETGYDITIKKEKTGPLPQNVKYTCIPARASVALSKEEHALDLFDLNRIYKRQSYDEQKEWLMQNTALFAGDAGDEFRATEEVDDLS